MNEVHEAAKASGKLMALIKTHVQRYPEIDILDVYKLLHQAVFGPGHAIKNHKAAREWLERETEILQPAGAEPLLESVHPDGAIVRLHLRTYLALKGKLNKLLDAFIESSKMNSGSAATMAMDWGIFEQMIVPDGELAGRFNPRTVTLTGQTRASQNWPASQHSPNFEFAYRPAYRVLTSPLAEALLRAQRFDFTVV